MIISKSSSYIIGREENGFRLRSIFWVLAKGSSIVFQNFSFHFCLRIRALSILIRYKSAYISLASHCLGLNIEVTALKAGLIALILISYLPTLRRVHPKNRDTEADRTTYTSNLTNTSLFLTLNSQSPMDDADKVNIFNPTASGPGSTPQEPLALVAKMSDYEQSVLEPERRDGLASAAESDTMPPEIRYRASIQCSPTFLFLTSRLLREVYYMLNDDCEMPSKVALRNLPWSYPG